MIYAGTIRTFHSLVAVFDSGVGLYAEPDQLRVSLESLAYTVGKEVLTFFSEFASLLGSKLDTAFDQFCHGVGKCCLRMKPRHWKAEPRDGDRKCLEVSLSF